MRSPLLLLDRIVHEYRTILGEKLVGVYLHGSLAMGCFQPKSSDLDFLVIVRTPPMRYELRLLADVLLRLDAEAPPKGFETSVMLEADLRDIRCPMPYLMHYSSMHRERYQRDPLYLCGAGIDPDLPGHLLVVKERGRCLYGQSIDRLLPAVPLEPCLESFRQDLESVREAIFKDPVHHVLNLCRMLCLLREGRVMSKREGGEWALAKLSQEWRPVVSAALNANVVPDKNFMADADKLGMFAEAAMTEIEGEGKATRRG